MWMFNWVPALAVLAKLFPEWSAGILQPRAETPGPEEATLSYLRKSACQHAVPASCGTLACLSVMFGTPSRKANLYNMTCPDGSQPHNVLSSVIGLGGKLKFSVAGHGCQEVKSQGEEVSEGSSSTPEFRLIFPVER